MKPVKFYPNPSGKKLKYKTELGNFASPKEAQRYATLLDMQSKGLISGLQRRVVFILIDAFYKNVTTLKVLKTKTIKVKTKKCMEPAVKLEVEFIYYNKKGKLRVEVVRNNYKDDAYCTKRKLIRYLHQISVIEN